MNQPRNTQNTRKSESADDANSVYRNRTLGHMGLLFSLQPLAFSLWLSGREQKETATSSKGDKCFAFVKRLLPRLLKSVKLGDKTSSRAAAEPPARALLRSNTCCEMILHMVFPRLEQAQAALGTNTSSLAWRIGLKSLGNCCLFLNSRRNLLLNSRRHLSGFWL